jgi:hypothetical protein
MTFLCLHWLAVEYTRNRQEIPVVVFGSTRGRDERTTWHSSVFGTFWIAPGFPRTLRDFIAQEETPIAKSAFAQLLILTSRTWWTARPF